MERHDYRAAEAALRSARQSAPRLADYASYYLGSTLLAQNDFAGAAAALEAVWTHSPTSPLISRAVLLAAQAKMQSGQARDGVRLIREYRDQLSRPQADLILAKCQEADGDPHGAAAAYQQIYYQYPASQESAEAGTALARLQSALGESFPPATGQMMLSRATKLMEFGETGRARRDLADLIPQLGGTDRDIARVRLGAADYFARDDAEAYRYLQSLHLSPSEADAERLYYLVAAARRLDREDELLPLLDQLKQAYPASPWRREALVAAGNQYLLQNRADIYVPIFRAAYEAFPDGPQAAYCHWKVAWAEYRRGSPAAPEWLQRQVKAFPSDEKAPAALYYLGRLAAQQDERGAARAYYQAIANRFPNVYYAVLARKWLTEPDIARTPLSDAVTGFLAGISFPKLPERISFQANANTRARLERARLLSDAGLPELAENELRFGAKTDSQAPILAMELAKRASREGSPMQAMRYIKSLAPDYLQMPLDSAPESFWKLAFPLPYRQQLARASRQRSLDPYLVAALIRQESEFNPKAVSKANAYGLTQVLPATGRILSRKAGVRHFRPSMLFQPDVNLTLGTYFMRTLLDDLKGQWERALASYNAGKSRVETWSNWGDFREPSEFVETIPFSETRNYVQVVIRNADIYRRLYGEDRRAALAAPVVTEKSVLAERAAPVRIERVAAKKHYAKPRRHVKRGARYAKRRVAHRRRHAAKG